MEVPYAGEKCRGRLCVTIMKRFDEDKQGIFLIVRAVGRSFACAVGCGFSKNEGVIHLCSGKPEACRAKLGGTAGALHVGGFRLICEDMFDSLGYKIFMGVRHSGERSRSPSLPPSSGSEMEDARKRRKKRRKKRARSASPRRSAAAGAEDAKKRKGASKPTALVNELGFNAGGQATAAADAEAGVGGDLAKRIELFSESFYQGVGDKAIFKERFTTALSRLFVARRDQVSRQGEVGSNPASGSSSAGATEAAPEVQPRRQRMQELLAGKAHKVRPPGPITLLTGDEARSLGGSSPDDPQQQRQRDKASLSGKEEGGSSDRSRHIELMTRWRRLPGALSSAALEAMEAQIGDQLSPHESGSDLRPIALAYLQSVVCARHPKMGLRNNRELITWCTLIDCLLRGEIASAMDLAFQRFGALEKSLVDNNWQVARWLELIPTSDTAHGEDGAAHCPALGGCGADPPVAQRSRQGQFGGGLSSPDEVVSLSSPSASSEAGSDSSMASLQGSRSLHL